MMYLESGSSNKNSENLLHSGYILKEEVPSRLHKLNMECEGKGEVKDDHNDMVWEIQRMNLQSVEMRTVESE